MSDRYLILGSLGQLGTDLQRTFKASGLPGELVPVTRRELDIRDYAAVSRFIADLRPRAVLNTAAYNAVDAAEGAGRADAFAINADAVQNLAAACKSSGSTLVHFSTDYVFSGRERTPRQETDPAEPVSQYGRSKLQGEVFARAIPQHYVFRVCGLFGTAGRRDERPNFVERMLQLAAQGRKLKVVGDQVLTPSYTMDVAEKTWAVLKTGPFGLYHLTNAGECSFFQFAQAIFELAGVKADLSPTTLAEFNAPAPRPPYSVLSNDRLKALGLASAGWKDALERYLLQRSQA